APSSGAMRGGAAKRSPKWPWAIVVGMTLGSGSAAFWWMTSRDAERKRAETAHMQELQQEVLRHEKEQQELEEKQRAAEVEKQRLAQAEAEAAKQRLAA